ncbi:MAG: hypothetical protein WC608_01175 [Parcubacteria group bacterium]
MDIHPNNKKQLELLLYKLLNDILFLWIFVFAGMLALESVVPGFFSAHLSFTKIILVLFAILFSVIWLGKRNGIIFETHSEKNIFKSKGMLFLLLASLVLIINSLRSLGLFETAIASLAIFIILLFFLKTFLRG